MGALFEGCEGQNPFDIGYQDGLCENMTRYNAMVEIIPVKKDTDSETFCTLWFQGWNLGHAKRKKLGLPTMPQFSGGKIIT
jgi:hypothetical protein